MSDMPEVIRVDMGGLPEGVCNGTGLNYFDPGAVNYIRADIADQLAAVLSRASSYLRDEGIRQNESYYDGKLRKQAEIGYTALEAYRKAKGE